MKSHSTKKNVSAPPVMYVKLSIYIRKYMESRYGKDVLIIPFMSPIYTCMEQYLVNNYSMVRISPRACSQRMFNYNATSDLFERSGICVMDTAEKQEYIAVQIPERVFKGGLIVKTSDNWQLSNTGFVEFNKLVKREFWMECMKFVDECFTSARIQGLRTTRENAISDFMVAMDIPMQYYENMIRYYNRMINRIHSDIEKKREWLESLNDTALTYT